MLHFERVQVAALRIVDAAVESGLGDPLRHLLRRDPARLSRRSRALHLVVPGAQFARLALAGPPGQVAAAPVIFDAEARARRSPIRRSASMVMFPDQARVAAAEFGFDHRLVAGQPAIAWPPLRPEAPQPTLGAPPAARRCSRGRFSLDGADRQARPPPTIRHAGIDVGLQRRGSADHAAPSPRSTNSSSVEVGLQQRHRVPVQAAVFSTSASVPTSWSMCCFLG